MRSPPGLLNLMVCPLRPPQVFHSLRNALKSLGACLVISPSAAIHAQQLTPPLLASLNRILAVVDAELWDVGTQAGAVTQKAVATLAKAGARTKTVMVNVVFRGDAERARQSV
jgi:hypothetical protein